MCLHPHPVDPVPEETARVARASFPKGNTYVRARDELGAIFEDGQFAHLFPGRGRPAFSPWRLALVTVMQFAEGLSDRQAADAVRARIDWKYVLSLRLDDPGFDASVLCEFRARLLEGDAEELLFDALLERLRETGLLKARGRQRTDSTRVLAAVRDLNRLELVAETMRAALDALAAAAPEWLRGHARPGWGKRYGRPFYGFRASKGEAARRDEAERIGLDGHELLDALGREDAPAWLEEVPVVGTLKRVWLQNYARTPEGDLRWRTTEEGLPPAAAAVSSPVDPDARHRGRHGVAWMGYRVHITETCEDGEPNVVTNVETVPATTHDVSATPLVHEALSAKGLLPETYLVDTAYLDASLLADARRLHGVDLLGPARKNKAWQAREETGFDQTSFEIDWERKRAVCPEGKETSDWRPGVRRERPIVWIRFSRKDCGPCPSRELCVRRRAPDPGDRSPRRTLVVAASEEHHEALKTARRRESGASYGAEYARREGIEGTISRGVRRCGMRRARYVGSEKTRLQHLMTATAINFLRASERLGGLPRPAPRVSPFARLMGEQTAA